MLIARPTSRRRMHDGHARWCISQLRPPTGVRVIAVRNERPSVMIKFQEPRNSGASTRAHALSHSLMPRQPRVHTSGRAHAWSVFQILSRPTRPTHQSRRFIDWSGPDPFLFAFPFYRSLRLARNFLDYVDPFVRQGSEVRKASFRRRERRRGRIFDLPVVSPWFKAKGRSTTDFWSL